MTLQPRRGWSRRKALPDSLTAAHQVFAAQAARVQNARAVVLACLPVGRVDPAPVPVGLDVLRDEVIMVRSELGLWQVSEVAEAWQRCADSLDEALAALPRAHRVAAESGELEELLSAVSDVVEPLGDAWAAAERRWLALHRRQ